MRDAARQIAVLHGGGRPGGLLERCLPPPAFCLRHFARPPRPSGLASEVDLVVWCVPGHTKPESELESIQAAWPDAPLLGVVDEHPVKPAWEESSWWLSVDDYVATPLRAIDVLPRVRRLLRALPRKEEAAGAGRHERLIGCSSAHRSVVEMVPLLSESSENVLITGETGTGKEVVARTIHYRSRRSSAPFIPINCGALPDTLFENELFGHAKGAYTDAREEQPGLLQEAQGGTVLLDEVDSLQLGVQVKLLRFLERKEYRPVGSTKTRLVDVRVLVATNASLKELVARGRFRQDLYYRLNILRLHLLPLRERTEDIPPLARHFLERLAQQTGTEAWALSEGAMRRLLAHSWPGNVRELEAAMHRTVALAAARKACAGSGARQLEAEDLLIDLDDGRCEDGATRLAGTAGVGLHQAKARLMEGFERGYLADLLQRHGGNVSRAAQAAEKDRRTFQRLLRKYGLDRHSFE
jgi:DNA-binding NtrC family response regulator